MRKIIYKIIHFIFRTYWKIFKPKTFGSKGILLFNGNILLSKNINVNNWCLPGGKVETGESPEEGLQRELNEELGIKNCKVGYRLGEYLSEKEGKKDTVYIFIVNLLSENFKKGWELEDAKWFSLNNLPLDISPATLRRIQEYKDGKRGVQNNW